MVTKKKSAALLQLLHYSNMFCLLLPGVTGQTTY